MPCYDGCREDARIDRETTRKGEAVVCGAVRAFGFSVSSILSHVSPVCETFAPPAPPASSGVRTTYYGDVRVIEAFDPVEGLMIIRADLYYREV